MRTNLLRRKRSQAVARSRHQGVASPGPPRCAPTSLHPTGTSQRVAFGRRHAQVARRRNGSVHKGVHTTPNRLIRNRATLDLGVPNPCKCSTKERDWLVRLRDSNPRPPDYKPSARGESGEGAQVRTVAPCRVLLHASQFGSEPCACLAIALTPEMISLRGRMTMLPRDGVPGCVGGVQRTA